MRSPAKIVLCLLLSVMPIWATDYYFSDCAGPGGAGTIGDPWCVIPTGETIKKSVAVLSDGAGTEFVAGDTAYVCAGTCDGTGSATYYVQSSVSTTWLRPRMAGTAGNLISIKIYPGEFVTISGDSNGNNTYQSGTDVDFFMDNTTTNPNYWTIDGAAGGNGGKG